MTQCKHARQRLLAGITSLSCAAVQTGCVYSTFSARERSAKKAESSIQDGHEEQVTELQPESSPGEERFPYSVDEEHERRQKRQFWALVLSPAELAAGAGITALAFASIGAPVADPSPASEGVVGRLKDSGKSALGTLLLFSVGGALLSSALGDFALGVSDRWFRSPFLKRGADGQETLLDEGELSLAWQLDATLGTLISFRGSESQLGLGAFRWLRPHWRLRTGVSGDFGIRFDSEKPEYLAVSPVVQIDFNPGQLGPMDRFPNHAISALVSPRVILSPSEGETRFGWRAGLGYSANKVSMLLGATQIPSQESVPVLELSMTYYADTD